MLDGPHTDVSQQTLIIDLQEGRVYDNTIEVHMNIEVLEQKRNGHR